MEEARQTATMIITVTESNTNSPVLQQMLKMLPSWPNALSTSAGHVLKSLADFRKISKSHSGFVSEFLRRVPFVLQLYLVTLPINNVHQSLCLHGTGSHGNWYRDFLLVSKKTYISIKSLAHGPHAHSGFCITHHQGQRDYSRRHPLIVDSCGYIRGQLQRTGEKSELTCSAGILSEWVRRATFSSSGVAVVSAY